MESVDNIRQLTDDLPTGIRVVNANGETVYANPAFISLFGFMDEEGLADVPDDKGTSGDGTPRPARRVTQKEYASDSIDYRTIIDSRDGQPRYIEVVTKETLWNGQAHRLFLYRDITEQKRAEARSLADEQMAAVRLLAGGMAHEINNPLTSIIGFSDILTHENLPSRVMVRLNIIREQAQRISGIIKSLQLFAGEPRQKLEPVDLNEIVRQVLDLCAYSLKANGVRVFSRLAPDLPWVTADNSQLRQVFFNIIINAEFFMVEAHKGDTLTVTTGRVGDVIRVSFVDDGPGIREDKARQMFLPFFTTKEVGKGTGLGLSICDGIMTGHGGRIWAESALGKGTSVIVEVPTNSHAQPIDR